MLKMVTIAIDVNDTNDIKELNDILDTLMKNSTDHEYDIEELELDIGDLNLNIRELKEAISRLEKQQYEIMKSINRIDALEEACKHNLNGLEAIERRVEKLAVDNHLIRDLHDDITKLNNSIYELNVRVNGLEKNLK